MPSGHRRMTGRKGLDTLRGTKVLLGPTVTNNRYLLQVVLEADRWMQGRSAPEYIADPRWSECGVNTCMSDSTQCRHSRLA